MGIVYAVYDRDRETEVALKTVAEISPASLFRFKREFRALADVSHPNLISLYELTSENEQWFFTMELLAGADILTYVRNGEGAELRPLGSSEGGKSPAMSGGWGSSGPADGAPTMSTIQTPATEQSIVADEERIRTAFAQLVEGVSALHASGHLHRDIKPSNVLVTPQGRVVLLDFGVITELGQLGTGPADTAGTPAYMAPEQADVTSTITEASDWYSVGIILYEALAGCRPFRGDANRVLLDKRAGKPVPPQVRHPDAPADLCELCMAMLDPNPEARPDGNRIRVALRERGFSATGEQGASAERAPRSDRTFVGREAELAQIGEAFAAAQEGIGTVLYVSGESGMGKSVLVRHFLDEVSRDPSVVVLEGRCFERESVPYKALDSIVDALCLFLLGLPEHEAELLLPRDAQMLARVFPVLNRVAPVLHAKQRGSAAPDPHEVKRRAFHALRELLGRLAERRPVVVFIDDLQWGDVDSAPLIDSLMRPPDQPPLLLLCCYRSEDRGRSPLLRALFRREKRLGPASVARELSIGALGHDEAVTLVEALARASALTIDSETLAREAGAHPYFIHELVSQCSGDPGVTRHSLSLDEVISRRIAQLTAHERLALEFVAVAGQPIEQTVVQEAARLESSAFLEIIRGLQNARLVRTSSTRSTELVEPFHDRIRETVVGEIETESLRGYHRALAAALHAVNADADTLAAHYRAAGEDRAAVQYAIRAADQAVDALAFEKAATLYGFAIEVLKSDTPLDSYAGHDAFAIQVKLADALANAGQGPKAALAYLTAVQSANASEAIEFRRCAALQYLRAGHIDEGIKVIAEVLSSMGFSLPRTPRGALFSLLWNRARLRLRGLDFKPRELSQITTEELCRIDTCWAVALGLVMVDTYRCADFQTRHLLLALRAGETYRVSRALALEIGITCLGGDKTRARTQKIIDKTKQLTEEVRAPEILGFIEAVTSLTEYQCGQFAAALRHAEQAIKIWRGQCAGVSWEVTNAELYRLWSLYYLGKLSEMLRRVEFLLEEARSRGDLYTVTNLCSGLPHLAWIFAGRVDEAESLLVEALSKWSREGFHLQHYWGHFAHAHLELYRGEPGAAYERMNGAIGQLKRAMMLRIQGVRHEAIHLHGRSALAVFAADPARTDCLRQVERDAKRLIGDGAEVATALGLLLLSGVAAIREDDEVAAAALERAETAAAAADLGLFAMSARRRRGELLGGDEGERLLGEADDWFSGQGVVDPAGIAALFVPGRVRQ